MPMLERTFAALVLLVSAAMPQQSRTPNGPSWEHSRSPVIVRGADGYEHVEGEILLVLDDWEGLVGVRTAVEQRGARITGGIPRLASVKVTLPPGQTADAERTSYALIPGVRWAQLNHVGHLFSGPVPTPNDTSIGLQWHLVNTGTPPDAKPDADIDILEAWRIQPGSPDVVVAVIDTGIRTNHVEFQGRLVDGWDFVTEDPDPSSGAEHGNLVAGVLGANGNNSFGVSGVDPRCSIMPLRAFTPAGIFEHDVAQALDYAAEKGAHVINMSWGFFGGPSMLLGNLALQAARDAGCILVAAAGNEGLTPNAADLSWPANSALTISIGWTDRRDFKAVVYPFASPSGQTLDFVAPGVDIATVGASPDTDGVTVSHGSSLAAPIAAGIISLILAERPGLTQESVYEVLRWGAEDDIALPFVDPLGWDPVYGHGRLNAGRSLSMLCACDGSEDFRGTPNVLDGDGSQALTLDAGPAYSDLMYLVLGSVSGTIPGQAFGTRHLLLNPDRYGLLTLSGGSPLIRGPIGRLDSLGRARAQVRFPPAYLPNLEGMVFHHAFAVFENDRPVATSTPVPVTPGPAPEPQRLVPAAAEPLEYVGGSFQLAGGGPSISVSGDVLVAGGGLLHKKAYVYRREGALWSEEQTLTPSNTTGTTGFGNAVVVDGNNILIGAYLEDGLGTDSGAVYAYRWNGLAWNETQVLVASDAHAQQRFGWALAVANGVAVVGDNDVANQPGAAYVFRWNGTAWVEEQKLVDATGSPGDKFGSSVATHDDVVLVGSRRGAGGVRDSGIAVFFRTDGSVWVEEQRIAASDGAAGDRFGGAVALCEDRALIGAHLADQTAENAGAAYLFQRQGGTWVEIQKLLSPEGQADDFFGWAVDLKGDRAVLGAPQEDYLMPDAGATYVYRWTRDELLLERRLFPPGGGAGLGHTVGFNVKTPTMFGTGIAVGSGEVLISAPHDDDYEYDTGAIYRFVLY